MDPFRESDVETLEKIHKAYFIRFLNLEGSYSYDDSDSETLYKLIKRLRLPKEKNCLVGWIVF